MEDKQNLPVWLVYLLSVVGFVYLLNPTAGFIELIPDTFPLVGNLDEAAAGLLLWQGVNHFIQSRKAKKSS